MVLRDGDGVGDEVLEDVRVAVYMSLAMTGRLPDDAELAMIAGGDDNVAWVIACLAEQRAWAPWDLTARSCWRIRSRAIVRVQRDERADVVVGGCAWDAFAIPHLVPECGPVVVASTVPVLRSGVGLARDASAPPTGLERAHFLVPTAHMWDDVIHTCGNQLLFCDDDCIDRWLERTAMRRVTGWTWRRCAIGRRVVHRLAWNGYHRREPAQARALLCRRWPLRPVLGAA